MKKVLSLVLAAMMLLGCVSFASAEEEKITLQVWSFTNELEGMINKYYAPSHPNVEIKYTLYPTDGGEYTSKVDSVMASAPTSDEAPDVFTLEAAFVKKYVNSDLTADLLDLGFTEDELAPAIPVMRQIGTSNINGKLKGLSWQSTPGALMYRADLAEKYLGVTTPEEMQAKVADWDTFLETAQELNDASEGAVKMVVGAGDIWNAYQYSRTQGWVVDGKLVIDDVLLDYLDLITVLEQDDLSNKGAAWSEVWFAGMKSDTTLCFFLPTWGLHYTLKPNCGFTTNDTMTDEEMAAACEKDGGTYGLWKMTAGPVGYSWGGTWLGANAAKVESWSDAKKAAVKDFIKFFTLDEDFLYTYAKDSGDFVGSQVVVDKIVAEGGTPNPFLGGQDHYGIFAAAASLANGSIMTDYDEKLNSLWSDNVSTPYSKGEKGLEDCLAEFKAQVKAQFPELDVD